MQDLEHRLIDNHVHRHKHDRDDNLVYHQNNHRLKKLIFHEKETFQIIYQCNLFDLLVVF
jgi:hypothetical protein